MFRPMPLGAPLRPSRVFPAWRLAHRLRGVVAAARSADGRRAWSGLNLAAVAALLALASQGAMAWERGNHAGDWTKGGTIKIAVDTPPGDATQQAAYRAALDEAMKEWNDAQKPFGGLTLELTTEANPDVQVSWKDKAPEWGAVSPGKNPVQVTIESDDGITARGVTRVLKHELGHVEGLGHSAASDLMKADAYSSTPGQAPSAADLNSADAFIDPTADDKAGKKALWGTTEKLSKSSAVSQASFDGALWHYDYQLQALHGYADPVTQFTLDLPAGLGPSDLLQIMQPTGWSAQYLEGAVSGGTRPLDGEPPSPSLLSFNALSLSDGLAPGSIGVFSLASTLGPTQTRAFTNSPNFDSDEFSVHAPAPVPEPSTVAMLMAGLMTLGFAARRRR